MICQTCKDTWQKIKNSCKGYRFLIKPMLMVSAFYLVAISAILRANFLYHDDIQRARMGWPNWGFSRHLSNILSQFLHTGSYLTDIAPLPQFIAVLIIALATVLVVYLITGEKKFSLWHLIAAIPVGLSPYFLECLSFRYDSPYMALSVLLSVLPLMLCNGNKIAYLLSTAVCMIGMSSSYQASAGIFPMLVIVVGIGRWVKGESLAEVLKFFALSAVGYVLGLILFRMLFMADLDAYASTDMAPMSELIPCAITNYKRYIVHFLQGFNPEWTALAFVICVCFLGTTVVISKQNKILTFFLVGVAMVVMFLLCFGVYPFLTAPLFLPRAMYGIGCFIAFQGIFAVSHARKGYAAKLTCLVLGWMFFVFSFTYGNALNVQARYTDFRITEVVDDLLECETLKTPEDVTLQITGTIGYAPGLKSMIDYYPMIRRLVPVTFQGDGWWGEFGVRYYYGLPEMKFAESYDPPEEYIPMILDNYFHTIYADEDDIWIDLHSITGDTLWP